jgi:RNA polymerase sigma-70 factor (family 1)
VINKDFTTGEQQLIIALKRGGQNAFRHIIESYQEGIIRVCRGFVGNTADAEDIAQEVFIQLYKSASGIRGDAKLSTWLYRVAVNKSLNHLRSSKPRNIFDQAKMNSRYNVRSDVGTDDSINESYHREAIRQALEKLPDNQRTAFILQKYQDLSYEEISSVMKLSLSSIQSLIFRARKNLQDSLKDYFEKNIR